MPNTLILARHGESAGNVDQHVYAHTADWCLELTHNGKQQAHELGTRLADELSGVPVQDVVFYVSPYTRSRQTLQYAADSFGGLANLHVREDPRLREQDFGNFQVPEAMAEAKQDRDRFGKFFYRFANGESAADVYDRVSNFLESLYRRFESDTCPKAVVVVAHGICINVFVHRWLKASVIDFEKYANLGNCDYIVFRREHVPGKGDRLVFSHEVRAGKKQRYRMLYA